MKELLPADGSPKQFDEADAHGSQELSVPVRG